MSAGIAGAAGVGGVLASSGGWYGRAAGGARGGAQSVVEWIVVGLRGGRRGVWGVGVLNGRGDDGVPRSGPRARRRGGRAARRATRSRWDYRNSRCRR